MQSDLRLGQDAITPVRRTDVGFGELPGNRPNPLNRRVQLCEAEWDLEPLQKWRNYRCLENVRGLYFTR